MQKHRMFLLHFLLHHRLSLATSIFLVLIGVLLCTPARVAAATDCGKYGIGVNYNAGPYNSGEISSLEVKVNLTQQSDGASYFIYAQNWGSKVGISNTVTNSPPSQVTFTIGPYNGWVPFSVRGRSDMYLWKNGAEYCELGSYNVERSQMYCGPGATKMAWQERTVAGTPTQCYLSQSSCVDTQNVYHFKVTGIEKNGQPYSGTIYGGMGDSNTYTATDGVVEGTVRAGQHVGARGIQLSDVDGACSMIPLQGRVDQCDDLTCNTSPIPQTEANEVNFELCAQASTELKTSSGKTYFDECVECSADGSAIWTAVGCISTEPEKMIEAVVKIGVGMGGGVALLVTLVGGFLITTSQGDPKRTQQGKEMITAAVIGILFVLFSVVILQFIGVTIFRLPGFGT